MGALSHTAGFSLIELMVSLAIAAMLIGIGAPAFNAFIAQQRMSSDINNLVSAVSYARSEAARLGGLVSVQARGNDDGNEWGEGYCVVAGNPGGCGGAILRDISPVSNATFNGINGLQGVYTLSFNSRGVLVGSNGGDVQLCSGEANVDRGRTMNISLIGRTSTEDFTCP